MAANPLGLSAATRFAKQNHIIGPDDRGSLRHARRTLAAILDFAPLEDPDILRCTITALGQVERALLIEED